jgi:hypothetical protein
MYIMKKPESSHDLQRWFLQEVKKLWPVAAGSLSLRHSPCIREHCPACGRGEGHASYALYGQTHGKRSSLYVPQDLVPEVEQALEHGRRVRELMIEAGWRYTVALKSKRVDLGRKGRRR